MTTPSSTSCTPRTRRPQVGGSGRPHRAAASSARLTCPHAQLLLLTCPAEAELLALRSRCMQLAAPLLRGYIWQKEPFRLTPSTSAPQPWASSSSSRRAARAPGEGGRAAAACLWGSTCWGENVEDEWLVVHLLLDMTARVQHLTARVRGWGGGGREEGAGKPARGSSTHGARCARGAKPGAGRPPCCASHRHTAAPRPGSGRTRWQQPQAPQHPAHALACAPQPHPPLRSQAWDNDGEFLLIEAAYALPRCARRSTCGAACTARACACACPWARACVRRAAALAFQGGGSAARHAPTLQRRARGAGG